MRFTDNFLFLFYLVLLFFTSRWPPLVTQANYSNFMLPQKSALPQSLLPLSQGSQPEVVELETGQLTQGGQSKEVRTLLLRKFLLWLLVGLCVKRIKICSKSSFCSQIIICVLNLQASEASSKKNDEVTEDLKTLLHEVRSLITSFQAHVSQNGTPGKTPSSAFPSHMPPAERALLDDGPVHPEEPDSKTKGRRNINSEVDPGKENCDPMTKGERQGDERSGRKHRNTAQRERILYPKPVVSSDCTKREFDREQASSADRNSRLSTSYELDDVDQDANDFALPLHSSSPKKDSAASSDIVSEHSQTFDRPSSPLSLSIQSDHSDVTSLLIDQSTSTADTVISRELLNTARSWKPTSNASSVTSSQPSSSQLSDSVSLSKKHSGPTPQKMKVRKRGSDINSARPTYGHRKQEEVTPRKLGDRASGSGNSLHTLPNLT